MYVSELRPNEVINLDEDRLVEICEVLGPGGGENAICSAMEDLAELIYHAETFWVEGKTPDLELCAEKINSIALRVGMPALASSASNVVDLCHNPNPPALAAVVARLRRIGEQSLIAVWDVQDSIM